SRRLNITLKIEDSLLKKSSGILPIEITKAHSDSGKKLTSRLDTSQANLYSFSKLENDSITKQTIYLSLPKRSDKKIFIEGKIRIYTPKPSSIITVSNFEKQTQKIIQNQVLASNGIELFFFTKKEFYKSFEISKSLKQKAIQNGTDVHEALLGHFTEEVTHVIERHSMNPGTYVNDIFFSISGNWKKVVSLEVTNSSNEIIESTNLLCGFSQKDKLAYELDLNGNLPSPGNIVVKIIQKDDVIVYPFKVEADLP
ncbi:MAG: hypothetical protein GY707_11820, partial [Desulfobacteraceae bacterium]|nr:hypothetical protein [Desulfobacteraceae bacterium]